MACMVNGLSHRVDVNSEFTLIGLVEKSHFQRRPQRDS
jgi:hypothetical protein